MQNRVHLGPDDVRVLARREVVVRDAGEALAAVLVAVRGLGGARVPVHAVAGDTVAGVAGVGGGAVAAAGGGALGHARS